MIFYKDGVIMPDSISLHLLLESRYANLRPSERKAADFILAHPADNTREKLLELVEKSRGTGKNGPSLS